MKVIYYWSEDGDGEICERQDFVADSPGLCYHCDTSIPVGTEASLLTNEDGAYYRMHRACADKGCSMLRENNL